MPGIIEAVSAVGQAVANFFGWQTKVQEQKGRDSDQAVGRAEQAGQQAQEAVADAKATEQLKEEIAREDPADVRADALRRSGVRGSEPDRRP